VSAQEKGEILALVAYSGLPRRRALAWLGLPKSTYYRWLSRLELAELLLEHYPKEKSETIAHLDFVIPEFRDMKMQRCSWVDT
jgi:hypothetical protein